LKNEFHLLMHFLLGNVLFQPFFFLQDKEYETMGVKEGLS